MRAGRCSSPSPTRRRAPARPGAPGAAGAWRRRCSAGTTSARGRSAGGGPARRTAAVTAAGTRGAAPRAARAGCRRARPPAPRPSRITWSRVGTGRSGSPGPGAAGSAGADGLRVLGLPVLCALLRTVRSTVPRGTVRLRLVPLGERGVGRVEPRTGALVRVLGVHDAHDEVVAVPLDAGAHAPDDRLAGVPAAQHQRVAREVLRPGDHDEDHDE